MRRGGEPWEAHDSKHLLTLEGRLGVAVEADHAGNGT